MIKSWNTTDCLEWTYERDEGDLVVFARTEKEALQTISDHGYTKIDPKKLKATSRKLADELMKEGIL